MAPATLELAPSVWLNESKAGRRVLARRGADGLSHAPTL
jgi:hypothetical protein